ncbi:MAG: tryptophan-rich sensory protein [Clostridiaceae bacterium]
MVKAKSWNSIKIFVALSYLCMVLINTLANTIPINGQRTGEVSDAYQNLFAPAGITFAIWGVIYVLLALYVLYQFGFQRHNQKIRLDLVFKTIGPAFVVSSLANSAWIFAWHYDRIGLSMLLMIVILLCLISINNKLKKIELRTREKLFVTVPFSIYFGWITIATIANATTLLVSLGFDGLGIDEYYWTMLILIVGLIIGSVTTYLNKDIAYGVVILWAYVGIWIKHASVDGFDGMYPLIIYTIVFSITVMTLIIGFVIYHLYLANYNKIKE